MANSLIAVSFKQPVAITVDSERTSHPGLNLVSFTKWRRTWRTLDVATHRIVVDFGAPTTLAGLFLNFCNFGGYALEASTNGTTWTNIAAALSVGTDDRVGRRKVWSPQTGWSVTFTHRYLRITPSSIDAPALGYVELGALAFPDTVTMTQNWGAPLRWTPTQAVTRTPFPGGGAETNIEGPKRLVYDLGGAPWRKAAMAQLIAMQGPAIGQPFFLFENRGNPNYAYILERTEDVPFAETWATFDAPWRFEEAM